MARLIVGYQPYYTEAWSAVVLRGRRFYDAHLPAGTRVEFVVGLKGAILVEALARGELDLAYLGDAPAAMALRTVEGARAVAVLAMSDSQCNNMLVRPDAPAFADAGAAARWLAGRRVASSFGTCGDRFMRTVLARWQVAPATILNQDKDAIVTSMRLGRVDAAFLSEPTASRLVYEGLARRVATGADLGEVDGGFLIATADLVARRPHLLEAWLAAELDAQRYLADGAHARDVIGMVERQTLGFPAPALWQALYGAAGATGERLVWQFGFTDRARDLLARALERAPVPTAGGPPDVAAWIDARFVNRVLVARGLTAPVGATAVQAPPAVFEAEGP
ncbi:MAG TPA: ABC transporter substrate-binding protein [Gammaproteobacteria bacterium]|nr:ABC transporter substrate-binding protein [Gammaproteobacteria bacterium]